MTAIISSEKGNTRLTVHVSIHMGFGSSPLWAKQAWQSCWRNLGLGIRHSTLTSGYWSPCRYCVAVAMDKVFSTVVPCLKEMFWCPGASSGCARRKFCIHTKRLNGVISFAKREGKYGNTQEGDRWGRRGRWREENEDGGGWRGWAERRGRSEQENELEMESRIWREVWEGRDKQTEASRPSTLELSYHYIHMDMFIWASNVWMRTAPGVILGNELIEALNIRHTRCKQTVNIICSDLVFFTGRNSWSFLYKPDVLACDLLFTLNILKTYVLNLE